MKTSELNFNFPEELIAQKPLLNRDDSKLFVVDRTKKSFVHTKIKKIIDYLNEGDLIVVNNSKVLPARFFGKRKSGGTHEVLLIKKLNEENSWEAIATNLKKIKKDSIIYFGNNLEAICVEKIEDRIVLKFNKTGSNFYKEINLIGQMPLPPYIKRKADIEDIDRYQTVYAKELGSVAAPTAGLHFTDKLIESLKNKKINIAEITLHVGFDTFMPVREDLIEDHKIHGEKIIVSKETADLINRTKTSGKRIVAIGTTSVRAIESSYEENFGSVACNKETKLFIKESYKFKLVDAVVTNFHRPKSTLLALVSAFAGHDLIMSAYKEAVENKYRLFSYGDSMLII